MKYIIKSCPACCNYAGIYSCEDNHDEQGRDTYCENIENCLLKRIVELCKKEPQNIMLISNGCAYGTEENKAYYLAQDILNLLEIEEVNE